MGSECVPCNVGVYVSELSSNDRSTSVEQRPPNWYCRLQGLSDYFPASFLEMGCNCRTRESWCSIYSSLTLLVDDFWDHIASSCGGGSGVAGDAEKVRVFLDQ